MRQVIPAQTLGSFLQRIDPQANYPFNHCSKEALSPPQSADVWYLAKPCKQNELSKFMPDISQNAVCSRKYTAHCLRSRALQALNYEGFQIRHIIYISGHRNEASMRSYKRDCSTAK